jgi:hypothetical protein
MDKREKKSFLNLCENILIALFHLKMAKYLLFLCILAQFLVARPTSVPTEVPTFSPTRVPTFIPSVSPSVSPSVAPSRIPTPTPTVTPSAVPTVSPSTAAPSTPGPSAMPTVRPSAVPTSQPSGQPSGQPISKPSGRPSSQPSGKPSRQPTEQPSTAPTGQPTGKPSREPSSQPTVFPSSQPSGSPSSLPSSQPSSSPSQPTSQPSSYPTKCPSSQPSGFPSSQPSQQPTSLPSSQPSSRPITTPTACPSVQPTSVPSRQPSAQPSRQPSGQPTARPSRQPTGQPTGSPTQRPSTQPSSQPTNPTTQPTGQPSLQPFGAPSSQPSIQPTSRPSKVPECLAGQYYTFTNGPQCSECPGGTFSSKPKSHTCGICAAGSFSKKGSTGCTPCPINKYAESNGTETCSHCPLNNVNGIQGSVTKGDCVDPSINFISAAFALLLSAFIIFLYLLYGRLQKVAFQRRWRLTIKCLKMFAAMITTADLVTIACHSFDSFIHRESDETLLQKLNRAVFKPLLFYAMVIVLVPVIVICTVMQNVVKALFKAMVLWRAYYIKNNFLKSMNAFINLIDNRFVFNVNVFETLSFPFIAIVGLFRSIKINLAAVKVSCVGAQAPLYLLADLIVLYIVVVIIEADYQVLWSTMIIPAMGKIRSIVFSRHYFGQNKFTTLLFFLLTFGVSFLPQPSEMIQYALGWVSVLVFVKHNGAAESSPNCDGAIANLPLDTIYAVLTTICAYLLFFPAIYLVSEVLVPSTKAKDIADIGRETELKCLDSERMESGKTSADPSYGYLAVKQVNEYQLESDADGVTKTQFLRVISIISSVDWLFYRFLHYFGNSVLVRQRRFLLTPYEVVTYGSDENHKYHSIQTSVKENRRMIQSSEDIFTMDNTLIKIRSEVQSARKTAVVPWFDALESDDNADTIAERKLEKEIWREVKTKLPTFTEMANQVREELDETLLVGSGLLCWFFPVQMATKEGRRHWSRVGNSYLAMVLASFGIWTDWVADTFDLEHKFEYYNTIQKSTYRKEFEQWQNRNEDAFVRIENDEQVQFAQFMAATVSTRIALIQLIPKFTVGSTMLTELASCPLFVSAKVASKLPPLIAFDAAKTAITYLKEEDRGRDLHLADDSSFWLLLQKAFLALNPIRLSTHDGTEDGKKIWLALFLTIYIFLTRSRLIEFVCQFLLNSIAIALAFYPDILIYLVPITTSILILRGFISAIYVTILLQRLFFHRKSRAGTAPEDESDASNQSSVKTEAVAELPGSSSDDSENGEIELRGGIEHLRIQTIPSVDEKDENTKEDFDYPTASDDSLSPTVNINRNTPRERRNSSHGVSGMFWTPEKESWMLPRSPVPTNPYVINSPNLPRSHLEVERNTAADDAAPNSSKYQQLSNGRRSSYRTGFSI